MNSDKSVTVYFERCQRIALEMCRAIYFFTTCEIEFSRYLDTGEQVTGFVEWDGEWTWGWSLEVDDPEGNTIPDTGSGTDLHYEFDFTASHSGEYTIRLTNLGDFYPEDGIMEICPPGWTQI